jgi:hypothetical protein
MGVLGSVLLGEEVVNSREDEEESRHKSEVPA